MHLLLKALVVLHGLVPFDNGVDKVICEYKWHALTLHAKLALEVTQKVAKVNVQQLQQLGMTTSEECEQQQSLATYCIVLCEGHTTSIYMPSPPCQPPVLLSSPPREMCVHYTLHRRRRLPFLAVSQLIH